MKADWTFLRRMGLAYAAGTVIVLIPIFQYKADEWLESLIAAAVVSSLHFLAGFLAIEYAFEKSHTTFLKVVLGGMVIRLFVMVGVVVLLIKGLGFDSLSLMLSLLGYYALNLTFEIMFLQKKVILKNQ